MWLKLDHLFVRPLTIWDVFLSDNSLSATLYNTVADSEIENRIGIGCLGKAPCELCTEKCDGLL